MQMKREMGEKGQIVVPKDIRENFNMRPGTTIVFEVRDGEVVIKPEKSGEEFLKDFLDVPKLKKPLTAKEIKAGIEEQYEDRLKGLVKTRKQKRG